MLQETPRCRPVVRRNDSGQALPPHKRTRLTLHQFLLILFLSILLLSELIGDWSFLVKPVYAAGNQTQTAGLSFQDFLNEGRPDHAYHGYPIIPPNSPSRLKPVSNKVVNMPPSAEPATMKPITVVLSSAFLTAGSTGSSLDLRGSDGRLEVLIQPGSFDLSRATVAAGSSPQGNITLSITQLTGHYLGFLHLLGTYRVQLLDSHKQVVNHILLRTPLTFIYHYQLQEFTALGLNPVHVSMTWPTLLATEEKAHAKTFDAAISLRNDPQAHTLTGQSTVLDANILAIGTGDPSNQAPPTLHLASVQGNNGQFTYNYPLFVAPGPDGFTPKLALSYSSSGPNERHSLTSPAGPAGEGWNFSLGSISTEVSGGVLYYFLNGVAGVGDRLLPSATPYFFDTEHVSYLKINLVNPTTTPCFHVWDKSGTYYELGCTPDSLQYWMNGGTRTNYRWDVNKIVAPNEGSGAGAYREILISYGQDINGNSVRDASIKQIIYGVSNSPNAAPTTIAGTIDFHYRAPSASSWAEAYGQNYNCSGILPPNTSTTYRCDDPIQMTGSNTFTLPTVFSTLSLEYIQSYVGDDSSVSHLAYRYDFSYTDRPYGSCTDPLSGLQGFCAGEHDLNSIIPTVYQYVQSQSQAHQLKGITFTYTSAGDTYSDTSQSNVGGNPYYQVSTTWDYLVAYFDSDTGEGVHITYFPAYNNAHGTPTDTNYQGLGTVDDRTDPFYCPNHINSTNNQLKCTGIYSPDDDRAWSEQVVTQLQSWGTDSSALTTATVQYHYVLANTGPHNPNNGWCEPDQNGNEAFCVGDNWEPSAPDWQDFYDAEYQGFAQVQTTSPAGDLTVDNYYSTAGWYTPKTNYNNFLGASLQQEDIYRGTYADPTKHLQQLKNDYLTDASACKDGTPSSSPVYYACETVLLDTISTSYEQTQNVAWIRHDYSYDDYWGSAWHTGYHNLTQDQVSGTNLGTNLGTAIYPLKKKLTYTYNDQVAGSNLPWTYYTVDKVTHSEIDDATNHVWQCQDITYDENTGNSSPAAGWPTTVKSYTNGCTSSSAVTTYSFYDQYGNVLASVDGAGAATPSLYGGNGCTVSLPAGTARGTSWSQSHYTACNSYDSFFAQPLTQTNAFGQTTHYTYDNTQGALPVSVTDPNGQVTSYSYSYDSSGNRTVQVFQAPDSTATHYTRQSSTNSTCTTSSTTPCFEVDTVSYQYNTVIARTFYDSMGRAVETRTPGPGNYDTIVVTEYNDQNHSVWKSNPFEILNSTGPGYIDPGNQSIKDRLGNTVAGVATFYDALNRVIAVQNQNNKNDGFACSFNLTGNYTSCINYSVSFVNVNGITDSGMYITATSIDPDQHVSVTYNDGLGRTVYLQINKGLYNKTLTATTLKTIQYNALDKPTSIKVTDLLASGTPSVTTTASYNDLGWMTVLNDPGRGNHAYTYDGDGRMYVDASGSRTLGYVYDLLGRVGCVEDFYPSFSPNGACSGSGTYLIQNTYDTSKLTVSGTTDYPVSRLTQSVATTVLSDGSKVPVTESFEHDARGQLIAEQMQFGRLPASWGVGTPGLPTYLIQQTYNDDNQVTTATTSTNPSSQGFTTYTMYNNTNGWLTGIGNTSGVVNLASFSYGVQAIVSDINFKTSSNTALLDDHFGYDNELRPANQSATWQSGSGTTGTAFSQTRSYDPAGNVTSLTTTQAAISGVSTSGGSETQVFCYDEQNRLVWAGNTGTPTCSGNGWS